MTRILLILLGLLVPAANCLASPEEALSRLEEAYRAGDIEAAVAAKDFRTEARLMLLDINPEFADDPELVTKTAEILELAFRKELAESGFPDFDGLECAVVSQEELNEWLVVAEEKCVFPDGGHSLQKMLVSNTNGTWKVVGVRK